MPVAGEQMKALEEEFARRALKTEAKTVDNLIDQSRKRLAEAASQKNAETWAESLAKRIPHWRAGGVAFNAMSGLVIVIDPDGKKWQMTKLQARHFAELLWQSADKVPD